MTLSETETDDLAADATAVDGQPVGSVIEGAAFDVEVGCLFEQRHQSLGRAGHPGLREPLVVEPESHDLEDMPRGAEPGEDVRRCAGPIEGVN